jgi:hypothetical protein
MSNPNFRPFNETDWDAFAGCESEHPLINDEQDNLTVIYDGAVVSVLFDGMNYQREFPDKRLAYDFALLALHVQRHETFALIFGEAIGGC